MTNQAITDAIEAIRKEISGTRCVARLTDDLLTRDTFSAQANRLEHVLFALAEAASQPAEPPITIAYAWKKTGMTGWALGHNPPTINTHPNNLQEYEVRTLHFLDAVTGAKS